MKLVIVVQARRGSSRLPDKVLLPLAGAPMLLRQLERILAAGAAAEVVVATTDLIEDDVIVDLCDKAGVRCHRGHPTDLLTRHVTAGRSTRADVVVKVPSDCPLIDPDAIARVLAAFTEQRPDYASNLHPPTWPDGNDVEAVSFDLLARAEWLAREPHEREHTTPYVWDRPARHRLVNVTWPGGLDLSRSHRFTVDWREDYELVRAIYDALWTPARVFSLGEILAFLEERPELLALNARYAGVNWYRHHLGVLRTVGPADTRAPEGK